MSSRITPSEAVKSLQRNLLQLGYDPKGVDGIFGKNTSNAFNSLISRNATSSNSFGMKIIPWGNKLTQPELITLKTVTLELGWKPLQLADLMACMAFESGESFSPAKKNPVSTATGLIQFMEATAKELGTTTQALAKMTVKEQLEYVRKYFWRYRNRVRTLGDMYMAILWPAAIGRDSNSPIWTAVDNPRQYNANRGLDLNQDGTVTILEAVHKIRDKYVRGFIGTHGRNGF